MTRRGLFRRLLGAVVAGLAAPAITRHAEPLGLAATMTFAPGPYIVNGLPLDLWDAQREINRINSACLDILSTPVRIDS